jgi:aspartyl/glutamyl-tRNA(Asn/Gln) amidotransferase C subunit
MLTKEEVEKLAELSRISLSGEEKESIRKDIEGILSYVAQIKEVSGGIEKSSKPEKRNITRPDVLKRKGGEYKESLLKLAPKSKKGYVEVKKIIQ